MATPETVHAENLRMYMNAMLERLGVLQQLVLVLRQHVEILQDAPSPEPENTGGIDQASGRAPR